MIKRSQIKDIVETKFPKSNKIHDKVFNDIINKTIDNIDLSDEDAIEGVLKQLYSFIFTYFKLIECVNNNCPEEKWSEIYNIIDKAGMDLDLLLYNKKVE